MVIIGIDPGTTTIGFGVIKKNPKKLECLKYGVIKINPVLTVPERLKKLNQELNKLIRKYKPKAMAIEDIFFFKNSKTAIRVSEAKGVILLTAAKKKLLIKEYTPLQIKMSICGYGRAAKKQIQRMLKKILNLKEIPKPDDAADALAIALSYNT